MTTMADFQIDVAIANRFISSLSKSLQALCHGCMDFDSGIEIGGYIYVKIDSESKADYVVDEKVQKSTDNSMKFVSNSFLALKDKTKPTRDGSCSPVQELQTPIMPPSSFNQRVPHHQFMGGHHPIDRPYSHHMKSQNPYGTLKRGWSGHQRDWRTSSKKPFRGNIPQTLQTSASYPSKSSDNNIMQTSFAQNGGSFNSSEHISGASNVKQEFLNTEVNSDETVQNTVNLNTDSVSKIHIKSEPCNVTSGENKVPTSESGEQNFLQAANEDKNQIENDAFPKNLGPNINFESDNQSQSISNSVDNNQSNKGDNLHGEEQSEFPLEYDNADNADNADNETSYPLTCQGGEEGETSGLGEQFDVIEIGDEDEDVQSMFEDNHQAYHQSLIGRSLIEKGTFEDEFQSVGSQQELFKSSQVKCFVCDAFIKHKKNMHRHLDTQHGLKQCRYCHTLLKKGTDFDVHVLRCNSKH